MTERGVRLLFFYRQTDLDVLQHLRLLVRGEDPQNPLLVHIVPSFERLTLYLIVVSL